MKIDNDYYCLKRNFKHDINAKKESGITQIKTMVTITTIVIMIVIIVITIIMQIHLQLYSYVPFYTKLSIKSHISQ